MQTTGKGEGDNKQYGYLPGLGATRDLLSMIDRLGGSIYDDSVDSRYTRPVTFFSGGGGLVSTAADYLRSTKKSKIGVLGITWLRPFPAADIKKALSGVARHYHFSIFKISHIFSIFFIHLI